MPLRSTTTSPRSFMDAYRSGELAHAFALPAGDRAGALGRPIDIDRSGLVDALRADHVRWGAGRASMASLDRLAHPDARVVVTGQQIAWLLGPSYTFAKTMTAIALAAELDDDDRPVVPVFWMATQDHDVAEMDHSWVLGRDERVHRVGAPIPEGPAVGRTVLDPAWIDDTVATLRAIDGDGPHMADVERLLREAAAGAPLWSDAFARLMLALLGDRGLVVVDPLSPAVATLWRPLLERELSAPLVTPGVINRAGDRLQAMGWPPQLTRAEGATNLFAERPGGGPRTLLRFLQGTGFDVGGERLEVETLLAWLDEDPTALTPAAGLRPVLQDAILPTAAFVVGPGELRYIAQIRGVYDTHDVAMPLVWPRVSATILQPPVRRILARHGLDWRRVMADPDGSECQLQLERHGHADAFAQALATIEREIGGLVMHVEAIDPTLSGTVHRGRNHLDRTVLTLREKAARALARRDLDTRRQFERLRVHLRPNGGLQERVVSPFSFFLTLGVESVRDAFLELPTEGEHAIEF